QVEGKLQIKDLIDLTNPIIIEDCRVDDLEDNNNNIESHENLYFDVDNIVKEAFEASEQ
ncbi:1250_t:CDS:1, partial [Scutellospora calospora]